ncbi:hypothetical protein GGI04_003061 [Coemansia thaxteri]|uniref:BZIP domain-containing protein n=1 Tax=Coemansia thaxteri TaxID=2663907 RepID=A0A9W8BDT8_9FUNG|nr:hypothetical protein GGI04_003061 [Coemansia thaxteri]KAJ2003991.1 hypothetical protein H4R26_002756 [Coemansia thaxteri]
MDKFFSLANPAAQHAQAFARHDDSNPYILPSFADNFEAWAYPETQQAVFEDWIATATPPSTAISSPYLTNPAMFAATVSPASYSAMSMSPTLSSPSLSGFSADSSPLLSNDLALSLASLQGPATPAARAVPQGPFSVADYAAALFPDIAATLSGALTPKRSVSAASLQLAGAAEAHIGWTAELAGLFETATPAASAEPVSLAESAEPISPAAAILLATPGDPEAEEQRKKRDSEFLASLPPQLALKRRRTSNMKQKEKILAELLGDELPTTPDAAATTKEPAARKIAVPRKTKAAAADELADDCHASDCDENDGSDVAALKRKKNTDAARRSRMRKILRIETLEGRVSELESENARLAQLVASLEAEKAHRLGSVF